jgi:hypothetical protein
MTAMTNCGFAAAWPSPPLMAALGDARHDEQARPALEDRKRRLTEPELAAQYRAAGDTVVDSYRKAGFAADDSNASKFFQRLEVAGRVAYLVAQHAVECGVTKETLAAEAEVHRTMALLSGDIGLGPSERH